MRSLLVFVFAAQLAAVAVEGQEPQALNQFVVKTRMPLEARTLKGGPYSADVVTEHTHTLAARDGGGARRRGPYDDPDCRGRHRERVADHDRVGGMDVARAAGAGAHRPQGSSEWRLVVSPARHRSRRTVGDAVSGAAGL